MSWFESWWNPKPPPWARFFTRAEYGRFLRLVRQYFRSRGVKHRLGDGVVIVEGWHSDVQQCGLLNLAQMCHQSDAADWPKIIAVHFDGFQRHRAESARAAELAGDFDRIAPLLAVRLYHADYLKEHRELKFIHRRDLPGTVSILVYDLPSSIETVSREDMERWERTPDELFAIGLDNLRVHSIPEVKRIDVGKGVEIKLLAGEDYFVASHALLLAERPDLLGRYGALVGVPHRHALLTYAISDMTVVEAVNRLIPAIIGMEMEGPGSISPLLYWYHEGSYVDLPYRIERQTLIFQPPEAFLLMLGELSAEAGNDDSTDEQ
jgi:hypothetical protein